MRLVRFLAGLLVSLVLLWLVLRAASLEGLTASLQRANYLLVLPAILVYFSGVWVRSIRWGMLLEPVATVPAGRLFRAIVIGFTVNDLMPVRIGELARAILLAHWNRVPVGATLGTIVVERLFDGLTLCGLLGLSWLWMPLNGWLRGAALGGALAFIVGTLGAAIVAFCPEALIRFVRLCVRPFPERHQARLVDFCTTFLDGLAVLQRGRVLLLTSALSVVAWLSEAAMYYLIMRGFEVDAGPLPALLGMAAANLGTILPSSFAFVGTFDLPLQSVLTELFSVDTSLATSITLVVHASLMVPVVLLGLLFLWREGLSLWELSRLARSAPVPLGRSTDAAARTL